MMCRVTTDRAAALRLVRDRGLRVSAADGVVAGGSPWRFSRLAPSGRPLVGQLASRPYVDVIDPVERRIAALLVERGWAHPQMAPRPGPHDVTVVIPAYGRSDALARCLASLDDLDIVVIDDGTPEPSPIRAVALARGARYVRLESNSGPAAARNRGLQEVTTTLVAFVDSDCTPDRGWLDTLVPHFDDERVGLVAPRVLPAVGDRRLLARFEDAASALDMGRYPALVRPGARLGFLPSATVLARREALRDTVFDESLRLGEDVDLVWRLADRGWLVRYEPAATVRHDPPDNWLSWARRRFQYGTSAVPLERRHAGRLTPVRVSPWNGLALGATAIGQPVAGAATVTAAGTLLARRLARGGISPRHAFRLVGSGLAADSVAVGHALRREYWPLGALALAASPFSRSARAASVAMLVPLGHEWYRERPALDPLRYVALRLLADAAYGSGVLASCWQHQDFDAIRPRLRRRDGSSGATAST